MDFQQGFLPGLITGIILTLSASLALALARLSTSDIYGLQHWKLNVRLPPQSMWMNLGYWNDTTQSLSEASTALLHQLLHAARILPLKGHTSHPPRKPIALLDLGFGCGDQTLELARLIPDLSYVGITLHPSQAQFALSRLASINPSSSLQPQESINPRESISLRLFCADAANPSSWPPALSQAVHALSSSSLSSSSSTWLLALDCLYHFRPSRQPIFSHARSLPANIVAFDLLLNPNAPLHHRLLLRLAALLMACPADAFLSQPAYRHQLLTAGYRAQDLTFSDISHRVFPGLVAFLRQRDKALRPFGLSLGRFAVASRVFHWMFESNVLRAVIVVARHDSAT